MNSCTGRLVVGRPVPHLFPFPPESDLRRDLCRSNLALGYPSQAVTSRQDTAGRGWAYLPSLLDEGGRYPERPPYHDERYRRHRL